MSGLMEEYTGRGGHVVSCSCHSETLTRVDPCLKRCIDGRPLIAENQVKSPAEHDHWEPVPLECPDTRSLLPVRRVSRCSFVSAAIASAKSELRIKDQGISHIEGVWFLLIFYFAEGPFQSLVMSLDVTGSDCQGKSKNRYSASKHSMFRPWLVTSLKKWYHVPFSADCLWGKLRRCVCVCARMWGVRGLRMWGAVKGCEGLCGCVGFRWGFQNHYSYEPKQDTI